MALNAELKTNNSERQTEDIHGSERQTERRHDGSECRTRNKQ